MPGGPGTLVRKITGHTVEIAPEVYLGWGKGNTRGLLGSGIARLSIIDLAVWSRVRLALTCGRPPRPGFVTDTCLRFFSVHHKCHQHHERVRGQEMVNI